MEPNQTFNYRYSAKENREICEIRKKYLPQAENKFDKLKKLDQTVQGAGMTEALLIGTGGTMLLGLGMCLAMQVLASGILVIMLGIILCVIGMAGSLQHIRSTEKFLIKQRRGILRKF